MRKLAIVMALASTALATPAVARDNSWYVGVEGGVTLVEDAKFDASSSIGGRDFNEEFKFDHDKGIDLDLIGGYDFGMIRAEVEAGYKRSSLDRIVSGLDGGAVTENSVDGNVRVYSAMANLLLDFGPEDGWNGYVGGGAGLANVRYKIDFNGAGNLGSGSDSDRSIAFQGIAGVRRAISENIDLGIIIKPKHSSVHVCLHYSLLLNMQVTRQFI